MEGRASRPSRPSKARRFSLCGAGALARENASRGKKPSSTAQSSQLRQNPKWTPAPRAVNRKIALIQRKNSVDAVPLRQVNQGGVRELRTNVRILLHHVGNRRAFRPSQ